MNREDAFLLDQLKYDYPRAVVKMLQLRALLKECDEVLAEVDDTHQAFCRGYESKTSSCFDRSLCDCVMPKARTMREKLKRAGVEK